ncbi:MAG TPA: molybdenum cofactor biosynthesis protein [Candidatus Aerophobetes bacterium]|uniref:Molybdopterin molybdenumtransferase n=1 Tax=Aerophobetes bacterium TaxID=2030807 RepID=A0A7V0QTF2_UNCAE|nr:molybdenum cofactor biosynthesis protein [Candidatus Aerophobetes bacterium]
MRPLKSLLSLEECKKILNSYICPVGRTEKLSLTRAKGRVIAKDVIALMDVPPFARAAMDGYAVKAEDTYSAKTLEPVKLKLVGSISAGELSKKTVQRGECIQIATGSPLPSGADAVVMVEDTESEEKDGIIKFYRPVHPGANVSSAGGDIKKGQRVIFKEDFLTPAKIGVLAALGEKEVEVFVKPKIAIVSSGNEIVSPGEPLEKGKIYDVNSFTLSALVEENGCEAVMLPRIKDEVSSIIDGLKKALSNDLVVITGGSSVGERDLIREAISEMGEVLFHGIAVKPGKPTLASMIDGKIILGMPGYPTSCLTNGYGILVPLIRKLAHLPARREIIVKVPIQRRITSTLGRHQFLPVKIDRGWAVPVFKESGAITSMSEAEGYIEIPANVDLLEKGDEVEVKLFT